MKHPDCTISRSEIADAKEAETALLGLGTQIAKAVKQTLRNKVNQHEFEKWYFEKYGRPYSWETRRI